MIKNRNKKTNKKNKTAKELPEIENGAHWGEKQFAQRIRRVQTKNWETGKCKWRVTITINHSRFAGEHVSLLYNAEKGRWNF